MKNHNEIMGLINTFGIKNVRVSHTGYSQKYGYVSVYTLERKVTRELADAIFGKKSSLAPFGNWTDVLLKTDMTMTPKR